MFKNIKKKLDKINESIKIVSENFLKSYSNWYSTMEKKSDI